MGLQVPWWGNPSGPGSWEPQGAPRPGQQVSALPVFGEESRSSLGFGQTGVLAARPRGLWDICPAPHRPAPPRHRLILDPWDHLYVLLIHCTCFWPSLCSSHTHTQPTLAPFCHLAVPSPPSGLGFPEHRSAGELSPSVTLHHIVLHVLYLSYHEIIHSSGHCPLPQPQCQFQRAGNKRSHSLVYPQHINKLMLNE